MRGFRRIIHANNSTSKKDNNTMNRRERREMLHKDVQEGTISTISNPIGISICISAYEAQDFIEECLDSIESQSYFVGNDNYEIILGIDGCEKTLEKVKSIQWKYRNLKVLVMKKNVGTYITSNTIMSKGKYDYLLRFDADDVMLPNMVEATLLYMKSHPSIDVLRPYAKNFGDRDNMLRDRHGCILLKKSIFKKFGGYRPWKCAADGEFEKRTEKFTKTEKFTTVVFNRRIHGNNLTIASGTNFGSNIRKEYHKFIKEHTYKTEAEAAIKCVTGEYTIEKVADRNQVIVSLTSYPARFKYVPSVIKSIQNNTQKPWKICLCLYKEDAKQLTNELKALIKDDTIELIIADENLKPHCKYYYTMKKYKTHPIITIDDDVLYEKTTISSLFNNYLHNPDVVSARRVHRILYENGVAQGYNTWEKEYRKSKTPQKNLFATGVGGVLYPPDILHIDDVSIDDIYNCIYADDILLKYIEDNLGVLTMWVENNKLQGTSITEAAHSNTALFKTNCNKDRNTEYLKIFKLHE